MRDQRRFQRTRLMCRVKVTHKDLGEIEVDSRDISDGGIFLITNDMEMPPLGTIVEGQVQGLMEAAPLVEMEIVRVETAGVGLRFVVDGK
ncbi:pilus assembly protein PilZ [Gammaproteobacteria bacterium 45_16_T64]|nr:pilus assembly protein PilZ [Gammaproteobacteria bacterium 45_16_T64]